MPKSISVSNISRLANLDIPVEQQPKYQAQIEMILDLMDQVKKLDLSGVSATARVIDEENILREDSVETSLTQEESLSNTEKTFEGFFLVPAIFEDKG